MDKFVSCEPAPGMKIHRVERNGAGLTVFLSGKDYGCCPSCGTRSASRHSSYSRHLKDLPAHGGPVTAVVTVTRWRCRNAICWQRIFSGADPLLATPYARQTSRIRTIIRLFGHGVGGRPSERIMARIGIAVFHTSILRQLKANAPMVQDRPQVRVAEPLFDRKHADHLRVSLLDRTSSWPVRRDLPNPNCGVNVARRVRPAHSRTIPKTQQQRFQSADSSLARRRSRRTSLGAKTLLLAC